MSGCRWWEQTGDALIGGCPAATRHTVAVEAAVHTGGFVRGKDLVTSGVRGDHEGWWGKMLAGRRADHDFEAPTGQRYGGIYANGGGGGRPATTME